MTFVAMSYNIWGKHWLAERSSALRAVLQVRDPDILAVQELVPRSRQLIDAALPDHERVDDPFPGWSRQSNIWWRASQFSLEEYGAEDVGIRSEHARLFWVRLRPATASPSVLFSTAHLTWQGHPQERVDDLNPRVAQARRIVEELTRLGGAGPCVFTADMNDYARPLWAMRAAGFADPFTALGTTSPPTHPVVPQLLPGGGWAAPESPAKAIDWQFYRGPIRPRSSEVADFFYEGRAPSDHKPVVVTYTVA